MSYYEDAESETPSESALSDGRDDDSLQEKPGKGRKRPSTTDNWVPAKQTKRYKESHKATEKHRRDKINVSLGLLADLVPQCKSKSSKPDKLTILSQTVDYIKSLRQASAGESALAAPTDANEEHKPACLLDHEWRRLLLNNIDDLFHVCTSNGTIVDILPSCKTVLGYEQQELLNRNLRTLLHPHDVQHVMAHIENPRAETVEFVARYQKKSGDYVWLSVKGRRETIKGQKPFILGVGRVFKTRQSRNDSYEEYYAKYALNGTCTYTSANVRAVLGFSPEEVVMKDMAELLRPEEAADMWGDSLDFVDGHSQLRVNHQILTKCGEYRWVETILWPFLNPISQAPEFLFGKTRTSLGPFSKVIEPLTQGDAGGSSAPSIASSSVGGGPGPARALPGIPPPTMFADLPAITRGPAPAPVPVPGPPPPYATALPPHGQSMARLHSAGSSSISSGAPVHPALPAPPRHHPPPPLYRPSPYPSQFEDSFQDFGMSHDSFGAHPHPHPHPPPYPRH